MKHTHQCPKCGSFDLLHIPAKAGPYGSGNVIQTGATVFSAVPVNRYVCMNCGYAEEWIDNREQLEKLRKKYGPSN